MQAGADHKVRATYHGVAASSVDDERGGRYATEGSRQTVIGSSPIAYPQQPSTSFWHHDPIGTEPPTGYSVDAIDPVGEPHEIKASERASPPSPASAEGDSGGHSDVSATSSSRATKFRRRI